MMGDPTLFQRADMVEAGWAVVQPILDVWKALPPRDFPNYAAGIVGAGAGRRTFAPRRSRMARPQLRYPANAATGRARPRQISPQPKGNVISAVTLLLPAFLL